jgi:hypothetical protein
LCRKHNHAFTASTLTLTDIVRAETPRSDNTRKVARWRTAANAALALQAGTSSEKAASVQCLTPTPTPHFLGDAAAQAHLQGRTAQAVAAGDPLDDDSLFMAFMECQTREETPGVTIAEVNQTRKRRHVIVHEQVVGELGALAQVPAGGVPAWFGPAMATALAPLQNQVAGLANQVATLGNQMGAVQDTLSRTRNAQLQKKNRAIYVNATGQQLHQYLKVGNVFGAGLPLRGRVVHNPILVAAGAEYPRPQFPETIADIDTMTPQHMDDLSIMMNSDFGVQARDSVATKRTKLREFLLFGDI